MWWGMADWGGLGIWSVGVWMIWYRPVDRWRWRGRDVRGGKGRLGMNVWRMIWRCLVYILNGWFSGICGGTSYGQTFNPSVAWKKWTFSKYMIMMMMMILSVLYYQYEKALSSRRKEYSELRGNKRRWRGEKTKSYKNMIIWQLFQMLDKLKSACFVKGWKKNNWGCKRFDVNTDFVYQPLPQQKERLKGISTFVFFNFRNISTNYKN